ncbi:MAG: serine hydrolase [Rhodobacteraceae bacterium]|nr:serine hydrolase [Paracoccaceae bacterium]
MSTVEPSNEELKNLVNSHIPAIHGSADIAVVLGFVGPDYGGIYYQGKLQDEAGNPLVLADATLFELGSVTKTFTATLYEYFVTSGAISKDAKLGDFYSGSGAAAELDAAYMPQATAIGSNYVDITLKSLANYTSGLPDTGIPVNSGTHYGISEMFQYLSGNPFELGKKGEYLYSNLGFALLAQAVATSQSQDFHTLLHQNILSALNMDSSMMVRLLGSRLTGLPMGYDAETGSPNPVTVAGATGFPAMGGAGALVSTPKDMMRWLRWNMGSKAAMR